MHGCFVRLDLDTLAQAIQVFGKTRGLSHTFCGEACCRLVLDLSVVALSVGQVDHKKSGASYRFHVVSC